MSGKRCDARMGTTPGSRHRMPHRSGGAVRHLPQGSPTDATARSVRCSRRGAIGRPVPRSHRGRASPTSRSVFRIRAWSALPPAHFARDTGTANEITMATASACLTAFSCWGRRPGKQARRLIGRNGEVTIVQPLVLSSLQPSTQRGIASRPRAATIRYRIPCFSSSRSNRGREIRNSRHACRLFPLLRCSTRMMCARSTAASD